MYILFLETDYSQTYLSRTMNINIHVSFALLSITFLLKFPLYQPNGFSLQVVKLTVAATTESHQDSLSGYRCSSL